MLLRNARHTLFSGKIASFAHSHDIPAIQGYEHFNRESNKQQARKECVNHISFNKLLLRRFFLKARHVFWKNLKPAMAGIGPTRRFTLRHQTISPTPPTRIHDDSGMKIN